MTLEAILQPGRTAVITGGASGIGLAAAQAYAQRGMQVCIADRNEEDLSKALAALTEISDIDHIGRIVDVADFAAVSSFRDEVVDGRDIAVVMNNAGTSRPTSSVGELETWQKLIATNLWGVIHGVQAFTPHLTEVNNPAMIINTGSKQGITNPPGNPAYNVTKAGVRSLTESLAHELRNTEGSQVSAHLLVPGFTYTGLISRFIPEKPPAAWTSEQVVEYMFEKLDAGAFYILCPDNDVSEALDKKRIQWNTDDLIEGRSALSRWDPAYEAEFNKFMDS